jgi:peptidoglycan/LPS O-acetylase OafA/YrhL
MFENMLNGMLHMHVSSWTIGIILFIVTYFLIKKGKAKPQKITHMILRLFYILIIVTGVTIVSLVTAEWGFPSEYVVKTILGLLVIGMMEMILVKAKKGIKSTLYWLLLVLSLILVFFYGYVVLTYL